MTKGIFMKNIFKLTLLLLALATTLSSSAKPEDTLDCYCSELTVTCKDGITKTVTPKGKRQLGKPQQTCYDCHPTAADLCIGHGEPGDARGGYTLMKTHKLQW